MPRSGRSHAGIVEDARRDTSRGSPTAWNGALLLGDGGHGLHPLWAREVATLIALLRCPARGPSAQGRCDPRCDSGGGRRAVAASFKHLRVTLAQNRSGTIHRTSWVDVPQTRAQMCHSRRLLSDSGPARPNLVETRLGLALYWPDLAKTGQIGSQHGLESSKCGLISADGMQKLSTRVKAPAAAPPGKTFVIPCVRVWRSP